MLSFRHQNTLTNIISNSKELRDNSKVKTGNTDCNPNTIRCSIPTDVEAHYDKWATSYENDLAGINYTGPILTADIAEKFIGLNDSILCIAAGTGLDGQHLYDKGFRDLHALDASKQMLDVARKRGIFKTFIHELLPAEPVQSSLATGSYDAWVCVGGFMLNMLNEPHLPDMLRVLRPGGVGIICCREVVTKPMVDIGVTYNLDARINRMVAKKQIEVAFQQRFERYGMNVPGYIYVLRKL